MVSILNKTSYPKEVVEVEVSQAICEELALRGGVRPSLVTVSDAEDGGIAMDMAFDAPSISRMRRITGYLSDTKNWHKAKRSELADRRVHVQGR